MKHKLLIVLFTFISALGSAQQKANYSNNGLTFGTPESVGMVSERMDKIDTLFNTLIGKKEIPGAVVLVARKGKIVYYKSFGKADYAKNRILKKDDIFRIASMTKAITATAVMMLWDEGKFLLDDPISKYIPEFCHPQILKEFNDSDSSYTTTAATGQITIRQLLNHTSGVGYGAIDQDDRFKKIYAKAGIVDGFPSQNVTLKENVKKLANLPLKYEPGSAWSYSEGLDILGYFVEVVSGQPFDQFLLKHLFEPLGMKDTRFFLSNDLAPRLVPVQVKNEYGMWTYYQGDFFDVNYPIRGAKKFFSGGSGLTSTAIDYAAFLQMYLNKGTYNGKRILSRRAIDLILSNQSGKLFGYPDRYWGLAFSITSAQGASRDLWGEEGAFYWGGAFNSHYFGDPKKETIGIILKQAQMNPYALDEDNFAKFRHLIAAAMK